MSVIEWIVVSLIAFIVGICVGRRSRENDFESAVFYCETMNITEVIIEDTSIVWVTHNNLGLSDVDLGYAFDDGRLVGVKIWGDVRYKPGKVGKVTED